ncbi:TatD DNase family protein [Bradyrhizobium sp. F1.13.4]
MPGCATYTCSQLRPRPPLSKARQALASDAPGVRTALGLHPQLAHERKGELPLFDELLPATRYVGEVGLDGGPEFKKHWHDQLSVFNRILGACANAGGRILSIHSRRAAKPVLDALKKYPDAGIPVLHWFSGTQLELRRASDMGCWFSVGPAMLAGDKGRSLVSEMPVDRILTETDGPFAQVDGLAACPWDVDRAVETLSLLWKLPRMDTEERLATNLKSLVEAKSVANVAQASALR